MTLLVSAGGVFGALPPGMDFQISSLGQQVDRAGLVLPLEPAIAIDLDSALATPLRPLIGVADEAFRSLPQNGVTAQRLVVERPLHVDVLFSVGEAEELLRPVSKGVALYRLAHYAANLPQVGSRGFEALGRVVAAADLFDGGQQA
jgi:hypothetical protein